MAQSVLSGLLLGFGFSLATDQVTVTIGPGLAYMPSSRRLTMDTAWTAVVTATSAWRHFYVYLDTSTDPATATIEASTTVPSATYFGTARTKNGDTSRRYLGSMYFFADGKALPFVHTQIGMQGNRLDYQASGGIAVATAAVLNISIIQTPTTISCATLVPSNCRTMHAQAFNTCGLPAYISNPDDGTVSATNYQRAILANNSDQLELTVSASSQSISYVIGAGLILTGGLSLRVIGYVFDR